MEELQSVFETTDPDSWIASLPAYQRDSILVMRGKGASYDDIAATWIAASTSSTAPFSSGNAPPPDPGFLERLRTEVRAFLCGDKRYDKDRKQILAGGNQVQNIAVGVMSVALVPYVGAVAAVLAPIIALILASIGKVSLNAWCAVSKTA